MSHKQLLEKKVELELSLKGESESLRHTMDELTRSNKEFDQLKRNIKKKQGIVDSALAYSFLIPFHSLVFLFFSTPT